MGGVAVLDELPDGRDTGGPEQLDQLGRSSASSSIPIANDSLTCPWLPLLHPPPV